ncbi:metallophosphoesterase [Acetobacteraceae bacterium H6797]|nr:metallophosphoesterase [Acetobacteraceae bacterium H6797]
MALERLGQQGLGFTRRRVLTAGLAAPLLSLPGRHALASSATDLQLVLLADLHSCHKNAPALLAALDLALATRAGVPTYILVNGDVFERGNAVTLRSDGEADWALLKALRQRAPVLINLGNHETALIDDMAEVVRRCRAIGLTVLSNIVNPRTKRLYAEASLEIMLGANRRMTVVGIATDDMATYRAAARPFLDIPQPAQWAREALPVLLAETDLGVVMSHAGVAADRAMLPWLPPGSLLLGGHEHLHFGHRIGPTRYLHTGSWARYLTIAEVRFTRGSPIITPTEITIDPAGPADPGLAALREALFAAHLTPADREVLGRLPAPLDLRQSAMFLTREMAKAAGAGAGLISNTTLGADLPGGPVTRYDLDAFIRFDGGLLRGEADAAACETIAARCNQDDDRPFPRRTGEYVYAGDIPTAPVRLATIDWVRMNAARYLGTEAVRFEPVSGPGIKALAAAALPR